jgi:uncharacterized membrane protein YedE/YeeE
MHPFLQATIGGVLIGLSSWLVLAAFGRVTGISGLTMGAVQPVIEKRSLSAFVSWRAAFIAGLILGGAWFTNVFEVSTAMPARSPGLLILAGVLVGYGTIRGSGCTSGHGVCGLGRRSARSLVAVAVFMGAAMLTVTVTGLMAGGAA